mmetsp:Transcript_8904/g.8494  ORF Transcript_8904/g.8494 Transcript_8904/m.8494 type:complete len:183 (-) Transcript_8904:183-731(-)
MSDEIEWYPKGTKINGTLVQMLYGDTYSKYEDSSSEEESEEVVKKNRGLSAVTEISNELAAFLGIEKHIPRTEVIKGIWKYIKDNDLQNPKDRREIILDKRMKKVFKVDRFDQCIMQKYLSAQIYPFNPLNLTEPDKNTKKRKQQRKGRTNSSKKMLTTAQREKRNHLSYDKSKSVVNDEEI